MGYIFLSHSNLAVVFYSSFMFLISSAPRSWLLSSMQINSHSPCIFTFRLLLSVAQTVSLFLFPFFSYQPPCPYSATTVIFPKKDYHPFADIPPLACHHLLYKMHPAHPHLSHLGTPCSSSLIQLFEMLPVYQGVCFISAMVLWYQCGAIAYSSSPAFNALHLDGCVAWKTPVPIGSLSLSTVLIGKWLFIFFANLRAYL